ncbi:MAG: hypothetical protein ACXV79_18735 [Methylobacter sp.]
MSVDSPVSSRKTELETSQALCQVCHHSRGGNILALLFTGENSFLAAAQFMAKELINIRNRDGHSLFVF